MSADLLRRAASLLRERAEAATPGGPRWETAPDEMHGLSQSVIFPADSDSAVAFAGADDAAYIATMHPGVPWADLLESIRCGLHCDPDGMRESYCSACSDSTFDHECSDRKPCDHTVPYRRALAVARAILGEAS